MALVELSTFLPPQRSVLLDTCTVFTNDLRNLSGRVGYTVNSPGRHLASPLPTIS